LSIVFFFSPRKTLFFPNPPHPSFLSKGVSPFFKFFPPRSPPPPRKKREVFSCYVFLFPGLGFLGGLPLPKKKPFFFFLGGAQDPEKTFFSFCFFFFAPFGFWQTHPRPGEPIGPPFCGAPPHVFFFSRCLVDPTKNPNTNPHWFFCRGGVLLKPFLSKIPPPPQKKIFFWTTPQGFRCPGTPLTKKPFFPAALSLAFPPNGPCVFFSAFLLRGGFFVVNKKFFFTLFPCCTRGQGFPPHPA